MQCGKDGEFFGFEAAEIDVFVQAMNSEKNGAGLELRDGADAFAFVALVESVAGDIQVAGILAYLEQQFIYRIAKSEQAYVGLQTQAQLGGIDTCEILGLERWFPQAIERFDIGPFQARHIYGEIL